MIVFNEAGVKRLITLYCSYHERSRTHLSLDKDTPIPRRVSPPEKGTVVAIPEVGGLLSVRAARGLNARPAAGGLSVKVAILSTPSPRRLPSTQARTTCGKASTPGDGKTNVTVGTVPIGERIDFLIGTLITTHQIGAQ